ncbi:MAG: hypothetical protein GXP22_05095 [Gammaproteobacteria bacterium]|nr:hypothetical protein [Gammaproteobacteria bacterium]
MNSVLRHCQILLLMLSVTACSSQAPIPSNNAESSTGFFSSRIEMASKYMRIGVQSYREGNYKGASWMFGKSLAIYQQQQYRQGQAEALINLTEVSLKLDDRISAVDYLKQLDSVIAQAGTQEYAARYRLLKQQLRP